MLTRKILMIGAIVMALLVAFFMGRAYRDSEYVTDPPGFDKQRQLAIDEILSTSITRDKEEYRRDIEKMKIYYVTLRDHYCTKFDPPSGTYWYSIMVCFDKEGQNADVYKY